jgi:hypothetical protein
LRGERERDRERERERERQRDREREIALTLGTNYLNNWSVRVCRRDLDISLEMPGEDLQVERRPCPF